jgi:hypothetical protein
VARLPDHVRRPHGCGDHSTGPQPRRAKGASRPGDSDPAEQRRDQERDKVVIKQTTAGEHANREPKTLIPAAKDRHDQQQDQHPSQQIERHRAQRVASSQHDQRHRHRSARQQLRATLTTELAGDRRRQRHKRRRRDRRRHPQHRHRARSEVAHQPRDQRHHRWLIRIPPSQMPPRLQKVQLITVIAVTPCERDENRGTRTPRSQATPRRTAQGHASDRSLRRGPRQLQQSQPHHPADACCDLESHWDDDEGWGVLISIEIPDDVFAHFSQIVAEGVSVGRRRRSGALRLGTQSRPEDMTDTCFAHPRPAGTPVEQAVARIDQQSQAAPRRLLPRRRSGHDGRTSASAGRSAGAGAVCAVTAGVFASAPARDGSLGAGATAPPSLPLALDLVDVDGLPHRVLHGLDEVFVLGGRDAIPAGGFRDSDGDRRG